MNLQELALPPLLHKHLAFF
uniref:Uncharacterized protein n=1 Tax=Anguilla anguilla TaxID=7936 RepID=A0A0E9Q3E9_ANGAN